MEYESVAGQIHNKRTGRANKPLRDYIFGTIEPFIAKENYQMMHQK